MRLERYAGLYGAALNPAHTAFTPHRWEVSLFSAEGFFDNNYGYLSRSSLGEALRNTDRIVSSGDLTPERPLRPGEILLDYFTDREKMFGVGQSRLTGPSAAFRLGEEHTVGLVSALRGSGGVFQLPEALRADRLEERKRFQFADVDPFGLGAMAWGELGLHYSRRHSDRNVYLAWGVTPKLILGFEGAFARAQADFRYAQEQGDTVAFQGAELEYALTTANGGAFTSDEDFRLRVNGLGAGLDLGVAWAMPADDGESDEDYRWKAGVSAIDLGYVRFKNQAEHHLLRVDTLRRVSESDFTDGADLATLIAETSQAFLGDPAASLRARSFAMALPAGLSLQFDYRLRPGLYLGAVAVQRLPLSRFSVKRPNTVALVPRFEHRWFSISMPVVFQEYQRLRLGLAARLGYLYLGTDNLLSFLGQSRFTGTDFYLGLKINAFSLGSGQKSGGGLSRGSRKKIKCYEF